MPDRHRTTLTNWGAYELVTDGKEITEVRPFAKDPHPSEIGQSLKAVDRCRVERPAIRESWLRHGPGADPERRGWEPFVEVEWDQALDLLATELDRVRTQYGNQAIYGGSYGWASAGRFHHALSQIHRFLNTIGGYTFHRDDYSIAAGHVITPYVFGFPFDDIDFEIPSVEEIGEHAELVVALGGIPIKNSQVSYGGIGRHLLADQLETCHDRGTRFVNLSPMREDVIDEVDAEWIPIRPSTDAALLLGLTYCVLDEGLHDHAFLDSHTHGWDRFAAYLRGDGDGVPKTAEWASEITGVPAKRLRSLAREMAASRTMLTVSWSVQRNDHGEYAYWAATGLAAALGQIGLPGRGIGFGYGAVGWTGTGVPYHPLPRLPQGTNAVDDFIPVARIADLLLHGGQEFTYRGERRTYPETKLVYWAGGNPFHHHQDLNRLEKAWQTPDTVVCHEPFWNSLARHSDIVLPATTPLERTDIGGNPFDDWVFWMEQVIDPVGQARNDYDIFADLAERLGVRDAFTEGRTSEQWIEHLYDQVQRDNPSYPPLTELRDAGHFQIPIEALEPTPSKLRNFRADPVGAPLETPSGRIELWSETIEGYGHEDCPPHPAWIEPYEWLGNARPGQLHMISNQPKTRLHSQLDHGETSMKGKVDGRERIGMNPVDAAARELAEGDVVRVFNERGATLASLTLRGDLLEGVVQLPTGAWWDPAEPGGLDRAGNPNVLTRDVGTSSLGQGPTAQTCLVEVERFDGEPPKVCSHEPPTLLSE